MRGTPLSDGERGAILQGLREGRSVRSVARDTKRAATTVSKIGRAAGIDMDVRATKKAQRARLDWDAAHRLGLLNRLFDTVSDLLRAPLSPNQLHALTMSAAVLIDKRRLEDGLATSRAEVSETAREELVRKIDELAERRQRRAS